MTVSSSLAFFVNNLKKTIPALGIIVNCYENFEVGNN